MISYVISCSSYRYKAWMYNLKGLKDKEFLWCGLLVFVTQYFISSGGYPVVLSLLFYVNKSLAMNLSQQSLISFRSDSDLLFACLTISFLVPIFEELLFRGVILSRLSQRFSRFWSLIIMSLSFGLLHGVDFIGATVFGYLCGALYLKFKNIWASILVHSLNNALGCLFFVINQNQKLSLPSFNEVEVLHSFKEGFSFLLIGGVFLVFTLKHLNQSRLE